MMFSSPHAWPRKHIHWAVPSPGPGSRRRWLTLLAMAGSLSMVMIDQTVVSVALPDMQRDLGLSQNGLQWVMNAYILAIASTVAIGGRLGDMVGRLKAFVAGVILFAGASVGCGLANSQDLIIVGRILQGLGGALMQPASAAIVTSSFPLGERGKAMAVYAGIAISAMAAGPLLGGALTQYLSWRWVFWVNAPVAFITIVLALLYARSEDYSSGGALDPKGLTCMLIGMPLLVIGIQQAHIFGWTSPMTIGLIFGGAFLVTALAFIEKRQANPLIQVRLFADRFFLSDSLLLFLIQFGLISQVVFLSVFIQRVLGISPFHTGLAMLILVMPAVLISPLAGRIFDIAGVKAPALAGAVLMTLACISHALFMPKSEFLWIIPGMLLFGTGAALVITPTDTDALSRTPPSLRGEASGLLQTVGQVGSTLGLAVVGALIASVEASRIRSLVDRHGDISIHSDVLRGLLLSAAQGRTESIEEVSLLKNGLLPELKAATVQGIVSGFTLCAVVMAVGVVVALFMMRFGVLTPDAMIREQDIVAQKKRQHCS